MSRLRILVIAEACNPTWTSVPLLAHNLIAALARRPDLTLTVCTHVRNREAIHGHPAYESVDVAYIDNEWLAGPLYRMGESLRGGKGVGWTILQAANWPSYLAFEHQLYNRFRRKLSDGAFDLIHRITPLTPTFPSPLAGMTKTPMIVGPLNGGLPWPHAYPELRKREREWLVPLRKAYRLLPYYQSTYRRLAGVISGSHHTASEVPKGFRGKRFYLPENGVDTRRFPIADRWPEPDGPFTFVTMGRLVPYKGFDLILEAMAGSETLRSCRLVIIGDGPERDGLEQRARSASLSGVEFAGWQDQAAAARILSRGQAFAFPSLREFGGAVVLEAMAGGLVPIVVDYGGPGELVGDAGIRIPMKPRAELVIDLRNAMERLVNHPDECRRLGKAAAERVREEFGWSRKADRIVGFYRQVLGIPA